MFSSFLWSSQIVSHVQTKLKVGPSSPGQELLCVSRRKFANLDLLRNRAIWLVHFLYQPSQELSRVISAYTVSCWTNIAGILSKSSANLLFLIMFFNRQNICAAVVTAKSYMSWVCSCFQRLPHSQSKKFNFWMIHLIKRKKKTKKKKKKVEEEEMVMICSPSPSPKPILAWNKQGPNYEGWVWHRMIFHEIHRNLGMALDALVSFCFAVTLWKNDSCKALFTVVVSCDILITAHHLKKRYGVIRILARSQTYWYQLNILQFHTQVL